MTPAERRSMVQRLIRLRDDTTTRLGDEIDELAARLTCEARATRECGRLQMDAPDALPYCRACGWTLAADTAVPS